MGNVFDDRNALFGVYDAKKIVDLEALRKDRDEWRDRAIARRQDCAETVAELNAHIKVLTAALEEIYQIGSAPRDSMQSRLRVYQQRGQRMLDVARKTLRAFE